MDENGQNMDEIRDAVDECNEEAKQAIENGTLVPESSTTVKKGTTKYSLDAGGVNLYLDGLDVNRVEPPTDPTSQDEESTTETKTVHVAVAGGGKNRIQDPVIEKQKYRNDVLSFMGVSYVSLSSRRKSVSDNMKALTDNKKYIEEVRKSVADQTGTMNDAVLAMNMGQEHDFLSKYDDLMAEGNILVRIIDEILKRFPEEKRKSVSFVSNSMVQSCRTQIEALKERPSEGARDLDIKRLTHIANAYANRQDAGIIMNKLSYGHNVIKHVNMLQKMEPKDLMDEINLNLSDIFKDKNMGSFRSLMLALRMETMSDADKSNQHVVDLTAVTVLFITHWLGYCYAQEHASGKSAYFKTFIMNVYDYFSKGMEFDIPGGHKAFRMTAHLVFACFETAMSLAAEKKSFKQQVKEYNTEYVKFGAAYAANVAKYMIDDDTPQEPTLVGDFLTEKDADEIAEIIYNLLHSSKKEDGPNDDVETDPETGSVSESPETGDEEKDLPAETDKDEEGKPSEPAPDSGETASSNGDA